MSRTEIPEDKKINLMLVVPMLHQGGFERVCVKTARLLAPLYNVTIAVFDLSDAAFDLEGLHVEELGIGAADSRIAKILNVPRRVRALKKLKRKLGTQISYSFGSTASLTNSLARAGDRLVIGIRSYMDLDNPRRIRLNCRKADLIISCSREIEQIIREEYRCEHITTVYNPIRIPGDEEIRRGRSFLAGKMAGGNGGNGGGAGDAGNAAGSEAGDNAGGAVNDAVFRRECGAEDPMLRKFLCDHPHFAVSMGREDDVKGFWHQLKAMAAVIEEEEKAGEKHTGLIIIGDGAYTGYRKLAADLGIGRDVYFTGLLRKPSALCSLADVYLLTSTFEGFPNALVESMAVGVPAIAVDCPTGPMEILCSEKEIQEIRRGPRGRKEETISSPIDVQYGTLIPPMDGTISFDAGTISDEERALAEVILRYERSPEYRNAYARKARERAAVFSEEAYVRNLDRLFRGLSEGSDGR